MDKTEMMLCHILTFISKKSPELIGKFAKATIDGLGTSDDMRDSNFCFFEEIFVSVLKFPARVQYRLEKDDAHEVCKKSFVDVNKEGARIQLLFDNLRKTVNTLGINSKEALEATRYCKDEEKKHSKAYEETVRKAFGEYWNNLYEIWHRLFLDPANRA